MLAGGEAQLSCVDADTTSSTVASSSRTLVVGNGSASELQGSSPSYTAKDRARGRGNRDGGHRGRGGAGTVPAT